MPVDDLWLAVGKDPDGTWYFDAYFIGRTTLTGGAPRAAAFAQWLLACPPEGRYEKEFMLVDSEPQSGSRRLTDGTRLTVEILLGREEAGGPEYLQVLLFGEMRNYAFEVCAPLDASGCFALRWKPPRPDSSPHAPRGCLVDRARARPDVRCRDALAG